MSSPKPSDATHSPRRQKRRADFDLGSSIGRGAFGDVLRVQDKETKKFWAMKILRKSQIQREKKIAYVKQERDCMTRLCHPNIIRLYLTFQDPAHLYYVVELADNGDIQKKLNEQYSIDIPQTKIIMAQLLSALAHMHHRRIIHRDIKPENMLLSANNQLKVTDFGTAKLFGKDEPFYCQRGSFVGSADYVSPETLGETEVGPETDLWSYACTLYQLICGVAPFHTESSYATFLLIEQCKYEFPDYMPEDAKDLIEKMLVKDPKKRLGSGEHDEGYPSIRNHPFFAGIDWEKLPEQSIPKLTPFAPSLEAAKKKGTFVEVIEKKIFEEDETIEKEGFVVHKNEDGEKKQRMLILTSKPRLIITNIDRDKIVKETPLDEKTEVEVEDKELIINKSMVVTMDPDDAQHWKTAIIDLID